MRAEKWCGNCKVASYCSRGHQIEHWKNGHKEECKGTKESEIIALEDFIEKETKKFPSILFEEWKMISEEEEDAPEDIFDDEEEIEETKKKLQSNFEKLEEAKKKADEEAAEAKKKEKKKDDIPDEEFTQQDLEAPKLDIDDVFIKFQCHIEREPEQCLRYTTASLSLQHPPRSQHLSFK